MIIKMNEELLSKELSELGIKMDSIKELPFGAMRNTFLIKSNNSEFILKVFEKEKRKDLQKLISILIKINSDKTITINPTHKDILLFGDYSGIIYPYFEGQEFKKVEMENKLFAFGKAVGEFDLASVESFFDEVIDEKIESLYVSLSRDIENKRKTMEFLKNNNVAHSEKVIDLFDKALFIIDREKCPSGIRAGFIHGDLHMENILHNEKTKNNLVIDIYNLNYNFLPIEIMVQISHVVLDCHESNTNIVNELIRGYFFHMTLTENEIRSIPFFMLLHKMGEVEWLVNKYKDGEISKEVFDKYMDIDPDQLNVIIRQYENLKKLFGDVTQAQYYYSGLN